MDKLLAACPKLAFMVVILTQPITSCNAQSVALSDQASSGSPSALVDNLFARWDEPDSPGCSVGISRGGELLYERGYGAANLELGIAISPATVFHAASVSKVFTAMSVMILAQQGKLSLDDEVRKYLPEFPEYPSKLTIRHLLSHTGGLRDVFEIQALASPGPGSRDANEQFVKLLAHQRKLNFLPGSEWQYSNGGYLLLATLVKRVSGQTLREFAAANIFKPLGMKQTRFHDDPTEVIPNRASGYTYRDDGIRVAVGADPGGIVGNAGLFTTAGDLLRWANNWDDLRVGDRAMLNAMATPTVLLDGTRANYGLGLELKEDHGTHTVGHSGGNSGFVARIVRYQEQKLAVSLLCNRDDIFNIGELADQAAQVYLPKTTSNSDEARLRAASSPVQISAEEMTSKVGLYQNPSNQQLLRVSVNDGKFMAGIVGRSGGWELTAVSSTRFTFLGGLVTLEFLPDAERQTKEIRVTDTETPKPFLIRRISSWVPSRAELSAFAGDYRSAELEVTYKVNVKDLTLRIQIPGRDEVVVEAVAADTFAGDLVGVVNFSRDGGHRVSGFTVNTTGVRGLSFNRLKAAPCNALP